MRIRGIPLIMIILGFNCTVKAQEKWDLKKCVEYAINNNYTVKESLIQEKIGVINYKQGKLSQLPSANFSNSDGYSGGKSQNPATGIYENRNIFSSSFSLQSRADIFNWFSKKNSILASQWDLMAAKASTAKLQSDLGLTVANAYLQVLLSIQQANVSSIQLQQSQAQYQTVLKQVRAGALAELYAVELEAQVARDSANVIAAQGNIDQAKYTLKGYMNLDAGTPFEVEQPEVTSIPIEPIADLQPENVFKLAVANLPQQKLNDMKFKAAQYNSKAAKGLLYPTISAYGSLSTNYGYYRIPKYESVYKGLSSTGFLVQDATGATIGEVLKPEYVNGARSGYFTTDPFGSQLNNNFGQGFGINISVPVFNGWSAKANYEKSKLNIQLADLQRAQDNLKLKQDIYQAYNAALVALERFNASGKAVDAAQKTYDYSLKRFNVGMLSTFELTTNQNNLFTAKLQYILNQFDYVFKMKVLEFYKGQGLKL